MNRNNNCDGSQCTRSIGEVRVLPLGEDPNHGNLILCRQCYNHELAWREQRNRALSKDAAYKLPKWEDLKVYE